MAQVAFRRIHGRVVPVYIKNEHKEVAKGAGAIGAGVGVALAAGRKSADLTHQSAHFENFARNQAHLWNITKKSAPLFSLGMAASSVKNFAKSDRLLKASFAVKHIGTIGAATMIGYGANKILSQTKLKDSPNAKAAATSATTATAMFAIQSKFLRGVGNRRRDAIKGAFKVAARTARRMI